MTAVDEGGPTRHFIGKFCSQMGGLVVYVPILRDRYVPKSENKSTTKFLKVESGWSVNVMDSEKEKKAKLLRKDGDKWCVKYENDHREKILKRDEFIVQKYPIKLFDDAFEGSESYLPMKDDDFEYVERYTTLRSPNSLHKDLVQKIKNYYRAIGLVLLHILVDTEYAMSSTIMPELLRSGKFVWN